MHGYICMCINYTFAGEMLLLSCMIIKSLTWKSPSAQSSLNLLLYGRMALPNTEA